MDNEVIDDLLIGEIHYNLARTYFDIEDMENALKYSYLAKDKFEQMYNDKEYAKNLFYLAEEFSKKGDLINSLKYSKKSLEVYRKIEHNKNIVEIERTLGELFYELDDLNESFKHFDISKNVGYQSRVGSINDTLIGICNNYLKVKDIKKCEEILINIEDVLDENDIDRIIQCNLIRYTIYNIEGQADEAKEVLINTYYIAKENGKLAKAGELAMRVGKYFIDRKDEEQAT